MAVESFLPPSDVKITIEKSVKQKPSVSDLTTIESPGRPAPADELLPKIKKTRAKKPKAKAIEVNRDAILIVTEKPQAALKIASALGNARKYTEGNVAFYEVVRNGKKIIVASAVGHLFNLVTAEGQRGWPIFEMEWSPAYKKQAYMKNYAYLLANLSKRASEVIVATDYDIEGEVIGWNVARFLCNSTNAKRMKYSTLTKQELERSYDNVLPHIDWGQAYAGETRHRIDWLYGINLSRALMSALKTTGSFKILSIGRVQGPALKIIVDREREIANFISTPYWQVFAYAQDIEFKHPKDIIDKQELEKFKDIHEANATTTTKPETIAPPYPFDLTTLQREAYAWHKISPSNVLKIAQSLYLDGLISYPRTSSQKIPSEIEPKKILKALEKNFPEAKRVTREKPVEGPKSDPAHPSIYPTGEFRRLEGDDKKIYELIVKRFISAFSDNAQVERKNIKLDANGIDFTASGTKIVQEGWMNIYPSFTEENLLPDINGKVTIDSIKEEEKETQPPKRYTPASLITLLEKKNLGTKTTRSLIIDTLLDRGYLEGKSLEATPLGMKLIESLEKASPIIINPDLTEDLETEMDTILEAKQDFEKKEEETVNRVKKIIQEIATEFKKNEKEIGQVLLEGTLELREQQKENSIIMPCSVCNKGNIVIKYSKKVGRYFAACDQYPECKTTYSLPPNALIKKTDKVSQNNLPILVAIRKGKRPWEFEFNPNYKKQDD
jgi:DNA topoisomerase-1